jgi:putative thioredoxin
MAQSPYIFDVSPEQFQNLVLDNSHQRPVLVNFWSPRNPASMMMLPRLIRLTTQCGGRFLLALVNADDGVDVDQVHGVEQIPTVQLYRGGTMVDAIEGDESEATIRQFINRYLPLRGSNRLYAEAVKAYGVGDSERALKLAAEASIADPDNLDTPVEVVKLLVLAGRFDQADELLSVLPQGVRDNSEIGYLMAHLNFIRISQAAPSTNTLERAVAADPSNLDARYQLAATKVVHNDYEGAMQQLLEIAHRNPAFRDHAGRNGLLALFQMLGDDDDRVRRYRPLLHDEMH